MPTKVISSQERPTYEEKPDIRYATTFLDHKYRDYSVEGEAMMDKTTGEIFMKRPIDGRIVSYEQNKKYLHDLVLELRVLLNNNSDFEYPSENYSAYFLQTHYDLATINDEQAVDLYGTGFAPLVIRNNPDPETGAVDSPLRHLEFNLSNRTNGFFVRMNSRDTDKAIIEYFTNQYNKTIDNYVGSSQVILDQKDFMDGIPLWRDSNIQVDYTVIVSDAFDTKTYEKVGYIRYNETSALYLPTAAMATDFPYGWNSVKIQINQISYPKIQFVLQHPTLWDTDFEVETYKLIAPDRQIINQYFTVMSFVNKMGDVELLGNEQIVALLDGPYLRRYMSKMSSMIDCSSVILRATKPDDDEWKPNSLWLETIRNVSEGGQLTWFDSHTDIRRMEEYLSNTGHYKYAAILVRDPDDVDNYLLDENIDG